MALSEKEIRVLRELLKDSARPRKVMAGILKMTESDFSRTAKSLSKDGIIKRFTVDVDYKKLGYPDAGIFMFSVHDKKTIPAVVSKIQDIPEIVEIQEVFSEDHDIIIKLMCENNERLRAICRSITDMEEIKTGAEAFTIIFAQTFKLERGVHI